ncbi:MAG: response regulator [Alphaproteobacteria bacterium]|nr:response regulator [Alphaproteobacteria bacterium]MBU0859563.1 response regulator [Alphaproteobacteria bacterium]
MNLIHSTKLKIVVIDDDDLARLTCRNILKRIQADVFEAPNGVLGVELVLKEKPNLVITDMLMPEKEGLETIVDIRASGVSTKIIAMSGGGVKRNMAFLKMAEKVGADRLMAKPFSPEDLLGCIKSLGFAI